MAAFEPGVRYVGKYTAYRSPFLECRLNFSRTSVGLKIGERWTKTSANSCIKMMPDYRLVTTFSSRDGS